MTFTTSARAYPGDAVRVLLSNLFRYILACACLGVPAVSELSRQHRYLVLAICCLSLFIVGMDATIVNVALPSIGRSFHAPVSGLQWTIDAYLLVIASLLMLSGSVADRVGRRRIFQIGLVLFTLGSLACSLAPSLGWLIAFRALQAIGGSMLNPVAMAIVTNTFTDPRERAKAIGFWGSVFGLSVALGPVIGGVLVDSVGWRGVFWVNIPIGIAAIALTARYVPESRAATKRSLDPFGQVLVLLALGTVSYGIIEGPDLGWASAPIVACFAVAVAAIAVLLAWSRRVAEPLLDLRFFRSLPFSGAAVTAVTGMTAFAGFLFLITLYLQEVRGYSALSAGLYLVPMAVLMACFAPLCGRVIAAHGTRVPLVIAGTGITAGGVLLVFLTATSPAWYILLCCAVLRRGHGLAQRADHEQRRRRHAARPRGDRRGDRLDRAAGRQLPRRRHRGVHARRWPARRRHRHRIHRGDQAGLVARGRDGRMRPRPCPVHQRPRRPGQRRARGHPGRPRRRRGAGAGCQCGMTAVRPGVEVIGSSSPDSCEPACPPSFLQWGGVIGRKEASPGPHGDFRIVSAD